MKVACRNVRTMLDKANSSHPGRRSALIAHELSSLDNDIASLGEVRLADEGRLQEHGVGFNLFRSGKQSSDRRPLGVGFMVRNSITSKLVTSPTYHSERIISMYPQLKSNQHLTVFSVYTPTRLADPVIKSDSILIGVDI